MRSSVAASFLISLLFSSVLLAQSPQPAPQPSEVVALRAQIEALKADYEKRIQALETQLEEIQARMLQLPETDLTGVQPTAAPATIQSSLGALNPAISVIGNFVGRADSKPAFTEENELIDHRMNLREAEIDMRAPVDPYADAVLITSLESDIPGQFTVGVEEGYVNIKKIPFIETPLGLKFQVGRFRPPIGMFNVLHTHDLPTTERSLPVKQFLGEDGYISQGISTDFFVPTPWDENSSLTAKLQVLTGGDIRISPFPHNRQAYLGNLHWFKTFAGSNNVEAGWSTYWHPGNAQIPIVRLHVVDYMYRWKPFRQGEWKSYLLGGEFFFSDRHPDVDRRPYGNTVFTQWQFDSRKYAGVRWDYTTVTEDPTLIRRSLTPYFSYYFSEFLRLRLDYEHRWSSLAFENKLNTFFVEFNWIFGSHPPEPFWVNK